MTDLASILADWELFFLVLTLGYFGILAGIAGVYYLMVR
jgi:hypothetical protein